MKFNHKLLVFAAILCLPRPVLLSAEPTVDPRELRAAEKFLLQGLNPFSQKPNSAAERAIIEKMRNVEEESGQQGRSAMKASSEESRVIKFDKPNFATGPNSYAPYLEEQMMRVSGTNVYVQNAYNYGYPDNHSCYIRAMSSEPNPRIEHTQGLPFNLLRIDVAEYSTVLPAPATVRVVGYKKNGSTVHHFITTDGIIDGTGPAKDFQRFKLPDTFTNLTSVVFETSLAMIDNIEVVVNGEEEPAPAPPKPPLIYDCKWDSPQKLNETTLVSGPYFPTTINFGNPTVATMGSKKRVLVLDEFGRGEFGIYEQLSWALRRRAPGYIVEFDFQALTSASVTVFFDGTGVLARLDLPGSPTTSYARFKFVCDRARKTVTVTRNGNFYSKFSCGKDDVSDFRISSASGTVGIDNLKISTF